MSQAARPTGHQQAGAPRVSAVIPTHDRPQMLKRAVEAVLQQAYAGHIECVVVFDKSTPERPPVVVPDNRTLVLVENSRTSGLAGARNTGVLASTGELVGFCDDDDEWLAGKVEAQVARVAGQPDADVVATGIYVHYRDRDFARSAPAAPTTFEDFLRSRNMEINPCTILVRREALLGSIGLVDEDIPGAYGEDYEWLLRASRVRPIISVPDPLVRIYWHESSFYAGRWTTMIAGLEYLLDKYPEFTGSASGLARIQGQLALAHAALGQRRVALDLAVRALRRAPASRQALAAVAVASGLVSAERVLLLARRFGRGI